MYIQTKPKSVSWDYSASAQVGATSAELIAADATGANHAIIIQNQHTSIDLYIRFGAAATTDRNSLKIAAGNDVFFGPELIDGRAVNAIASSASAEVLVMIAKNS